ncbi:hypothetical protein [Chryseobacterium sp. G0201]|uniref:hypothetical protein n=1 Tax=Chryseobacterium sp. G0201 TaxID=2487065 RepID=UPI000F4FF3A4|nr:hypothetical protein [Chryseobacterium sp. G0201]AZA53759.1 hypothetical protein EG348_12440 [Chryseobacterium sp. G0201]
MYYLKKKFLDIFQNFHLKTYVLTDHISFHNQDKRIEVYKVLCEKLDDANFLDYVMVDLNAPNKYGFYPYASSVAFKDFLKMK